MQEFGDIFLVFHFKIIQVNFCNPVPQFEQGFFGEFIGCGEFWVLHGSQKQVVKIL